VFAVDNLQAADDDSAAFIAALARDSSTESVVVLTARRKGERVSARNAFSALRSHSTRIKLNDLDLPSCEALTRNMFGNAPNSAFVARVLHERSGGNPQHLIELVELLVERGIARYVDGNWVLPLEISDDELPSRFDEIFATRLRGLSPTARAIAEALSVHASALSIGRCLSLVEDKDDGEKRRALGVLVAEGILDFEGDSYRFRQEAMRQAVLSRLDLPARQAVHRRLGEMLVATADDDVATRLAAAWHLVRGGAEARGADLLAASARQLLDRKDMQQEAGPTVRALIAAIAVYDKERRSDFELASLLLPLIPISFYVDWRLPLKYGERAIEIGFRITGLQNAHRWSRFLGKKLALIAALLIASFRFKRAFRHSGSYTLREAIVDVCRAITPVIGTYSICFDGPGTERIGKLTEPLKLFGENHIGGVIHAHCNSRMLINGGRECEAVEVLVGTTTKLSDPKLFPELSKYARKSLYATDLYPLGLIRANGLGTRALEIADELAQDGDRLWATIAEQIRLVYHSNRGELEQARQYREKVELYVIQGGTTWQTDIFLPVLMFLVAFMTGDPFAIREIWQQLERRAKDIRSLAVYAEAAHTGYLALRGELAEAIARYERFLPDVPPHRVTGWMTVRSQFAETLILAGQYARARQVALDALSQVTEAEAPFVLVYAEIRRHLAVAEAGLKNYSEAVKILDDFLARYASEDQPLLIGLFHKARAQVALQMADRSKFQHHLEEMRKNFQRTMTPALVAQCDRLVEQASALEQPRSAPATDATRSANVNPEIQGVYQMLSDFDDPRECSQHALELVVKEANARAGYLYLLRPNGLELAAASGPGEAPASLKQKLAELVERAYRREQAQHDKLADVPKTALTEASLSAGFAPTKIETAEVREGLSEHSAEYRLMLLSTRPAGSLVVLGGIVLELTLSSKLGLSSEYLDAIASVLHDASDVTSIVEDSSIQPP
jgi:tetratricopeptide (TPR) repeat protein